MTIIGFYPNVQLLIRELQKANGKEKAYELITQICDVYEQCVHGMVAGGRILLLVIFDPLVKLLHESSLCFRFAFDVFGGYFDQGQGGFGFFQSFQQDFHKYAALIGQGTIGTVPDSNDSDEAIAGVMVMFYHLHRDVTQLFAQASMFGCIVFIIIHGWAIDPECQRLRAGELQNSVSPLY